MALSGARMSDVKLGGVYRAIVTNVDDPQGRLRIKMKVPQELGDAETEWAWPALPIGLKQVPAAQTPVWVMFEGGDPKYPVYIGSWLPAGQLLGAEVGDFTIGVLKYADKRHHFDPPTLLSNSPTPGSISWGSFVMVYNSKAYTIAAGNTPLAFVYWHFGDTVLTASAALPTLTVDDCLIFLNKLGIAANAQLATGVDGSLIVSGSIFADAIAAGSIGTDQLAANSITAGNIAAGAINGQIITGATVQSAASGARVVLATAGLSAYNVAGDQTVMINSSDGSTVIGAVINSTSRLAINSAGVTLLYRSSTGIDKSVVAIDNSGNAVFSGKLQIGSGPVHGSNYLEISKSVSTPLADSTWVSIPWDGYIAQVNDDGISGITGGIWFKSTITGMWLVTATVTVNGSGSFPCEVRISDTVHTFAQAGWDHGDSDTFTLTTLVYLVANSQLRCEVRQTSGSGKAADATAADSPQLFSFCLIG